MHANQQDQQEQRTVRYTVELTANGASHADFRSDVQENGGEIVAEEVVPADDSGFDAPDGWMSIDVDNASTRLDKDSAFVEGIMRDVDGVQVIIWETPPRESGYRFADEAPDSATEQPRYHVELWGVPNGRKAPVSQNRRGFENDREAAEAKARELAVEYSVNGVDR
jgi:hypothetical protein